MDNADQGAVETRGYSPAEAAHMIELYLEGDLSLEGLEDWLRQYPYAPNGPQPNDVEDEINRAVLAVRGYRSGSRDDEALRRELRDVRSHLSGYGFMAGQTAVSGETRDPTGKPNDRAFP
ncbi:MAG TPA: hypothetical protein VFX49_00635 [Chloroflexota bacterium]|nr:hypothetical protein [Chloroflexota bacterium]